MIQLDGVTKVFRRQRVLDSLSLSIAAGDRIALIGANGAGKTTMIRCLLGEYTHQGEITVGGRRPRRERRAVLSDIAFVPQMPPPLKMPVRDLLRFAAKTCNADPAHMEEIGERLGLDLAEVSGKPFFKLSGGQKQKILVAVALGRESRVLIFDEPTANLDPAARRVLFGLLAERLDRGMIISSHRLEEISGLVNRVVEMDRGRVILDDRVVETVDPGSLQKCVVTLGEPDAAFAKAVGEWGFVANESGTAWNGDVPGPDRIRFLGMITRYAGLLRSFELTAASGSNGNAEKRT
ncbi:MAG: ABC transporter ATP-binding protein [Hyphomicrobiales bacterium]|nr:MAG: ABC transporter ATP-binding protein [Hyphomicrobiales bacterium]